MRVQVYGVGCAKCTELAKRAEEAVRRLGLDAPVEKVTDLKQIMEAGVLLTPALAVDGAIKASGRVPSVAEIEKMLGA